MTEYNNYGPSGYISFYRNDYKKSDVQPDFSGNVLIPFDLVNMASESDDCHVEIKGERYLKFQIKGWHNDSDTTKPIISGRVSMFKKSEPKTDAPPKSGKRKLV